MMILVVDDDELVRRVVTELLEDLSFSVLEARSGKEALALVLTRTDLSLVISDVNMPEMDGLELAQELLTIRPSLPVILMSGRAIKDLDRSFLPKPFTRQRLLACVTSATAVMAIAGEHHALSSH